MFRIKNLAVAVTLISIVYSCKKEDVPHTSDKLLVRTIAGSDSIVYTSYYYDSQDRLINIRDTNSQGHTENISITYNDDGHPLKIVNSWAFSDGTQVQTRSDSLIYENGKVVSQLRWYNFPSEAQSRNFQMSTYTYDATGRRVSDSIQYKINDTFQLAEYTYYSYGSDENVQQIQHDYVLNGGIPNQNWKLTPSYSSAPNPYINLGKALYYLDDIIVSPQYFLLSKNRLAEVVAFQNGSYSGTTTYSYEYNNDGLVQKMVMAISNSLYPFTIKFYYK